MVRCRAPAEDLVGRRRSSGECRWRFGGAGIGRSLHGHRRPHSRSAPRPGSARRCSDYSAAPADLPGFEEKDIDITLEGDILTLRADAPRALPEGFKVVRSERSRVRLLKQIELPVRVDVDGVSASFTDGVLELKLPKAADARPRRIPVTGTKTESKEGASA